MVTVLALALMFAVACVAIGVGDWRGGEVRRARALFVSALALFGLAALVVFLTLSSSEPDLLWCNAISKRGNGCAATMDRYQRAQHDKKKE
jgi:hypothetical protein